MAQNTQNSPELELNEILRLRREKLNALKEAGNDPYKITKYDFDSDSENIKKNFAPDIKDSCSRWIFFLL